MRSLSEVEVLERDAEIDKALNLVSEFGECFGLEIPDFCSRFDDESMGMVVNDNSCRDVEWVRKTASSVGSQIIRKFSELIVLQLSSLSGTDDVLAGSSWAVSTKLSARFLYGIRNWDRELDIEDIHFYARDVLGKYFNPDFTRLFGVSFDSIVESVRVVYEEDFMRYKLWRKEDVECLCRYLFVGAGSAYAEEFEDGALEYIFEQDKVLCVDEFIRAVSDALQELPVRNCTEMEFPECRERINMYGAKWRRRLDDVSCIFSEYVPAEFMREELLSWIYERYVEYHKSYGGVSPNKPLLFK